MLAQRLTPTDWPWRAHLRRLACLLACFLPALAISQTTFEKEQGFRAAVAQGESAPARALLSDLLRSDSLNVYRLVAPIETLFLPGEFRGDAAPSQADLSTLLRVYALGQRHDPAGPATWLQRKAMLALRYPLQFQDDMRPLLRAAILADPHDCPLLLYQRWLETGLASYQSGTLPLEALAQDWASASALLYSREIRQTEDAEATARTTRQIALQLRAAIPDCDKLARTYGKAVRQQSLSAAACADFLALYALQDCYEVSDLWASAFEQALAGAPSPWLYRLAAADALNSKDYRQSLAQWEAAARLENDPALQAADLLHGAQVRAALGEYRAARRTILQAAALHPNWGAPYLQLADLYLQGVGSCAFSPFDQKAIYWLLIDLCHTAKNVDAAATQAANRRIYAYRKRMPTQKEAAFKGLKEGDTWPLRCWMSTVTTVKIH